MPFLKVIEELESNELEAEIELRADSGAAGFQRRPDDNSNGVVGTNLMRASLHCPTGRKGCLLETGPAADPSAFPGARRYRLSEPASRSLWSYWPRPRGLTEDHILRFDSNGRDGEVGTGDTDEGATEHCPLFPPLFPPRRHRRGCYRTLSPIPPYSPLFPSPIPPIPLFPSP
jgi:hypothetical protein